MIQQTSLTNYQTIKKKLGEQQRRVYFTLRGLGEATNTMLSKSSNLPINVITPRILELRHKGYVFQSKIDLCEVTHKKAIYWRCNRIKQYII